MSKPKSTKPAKTKGSPEPDVQHGLMTTTSTSYKNTAGTTETATRHEPCAGKGCAECGGLGFTSTAPVGKGLGL